MDISKQKRIDSLLKRIAAAFSDVPRPRITKNVARGYDDEWMLSEIRVQELSNLDVERNWTDVTENDVRVFQEYFFFSDAEGWRFYLPAYISYYLKGFPDCGWDAVYWACANPEPKFDLLNPEQRACIDDFLELVHEQED